MTPRPLEAHSLAEIQLYLMATPCDACGRGPLERLGKWNTPEHSEVRLVARCGACGERRKLSFSLPDDHPAEDPRALYPVVNPTDEPSEIIDVGQWIVLFRVIIEAAADEEDKIAARRLGYEAAQCLEEAVKFYGPDDELPPEEAIFTEATRNRRRERPELFSKRRLLEMRAKLPRTTTMRKQIGESGPTGAKRWWPFGRK
jgi:hypothetical protein